MKRLAPYFSRILALLLKLQPVEGEYDVTWAGPYYIPRSGEWHPSTFMLYRGKLFASLYIGSRCHSLSWLLDSTVVTVEHGLFTASFLLQEQQWCQALGQIERRLRAASRNPAVYNRRVQRCLPLSCRTGKVQRALCWPKGTRRSILKLDLSRLERAMKRPFTAKSLKNMTVARYLGVVGVAYDAGFKELRGLPAREKYKRRADGRHGGLLDLPPHSARAFARWFKGRKWAGTHPWEVVFGHPHGILISPHCELETQRWSYVLSVSTERLFVVAVRMALALSAAEVPFQFHDWQKVTAALAGLDYVEVGPDSMRIDYESLRETRPDALSEIQWDPVPLAAPITPDQMARVAAQLRPSRVEKATSSGDADKN